VTIPVILDVDTGIDDAWAIWSALRSPVLTVLGITTGYGNADVETTTRNTLLITELAHSDVPVVPGAAKPLWTPWEGPVPDFHGHNGLGDADLPPVFRKPTPGDAAQFIRETVRAHPGDITIITVARLTNLARALLYDPELAPLIRQLVVMGGAAFCPGNVTPVAEANIWGDPEAAQLVLSAGIPTILVGLDVTHQARLTRDMVEGMRRHDPASRLFYHATRFYLDAYRRSSPVFDDWCPVHDALAVFVAEEPDLVKAERYPVAIETTGRLTRGMTVVDSRSGPYPRSPVEVAVGLDGPRFLTAFLSRSGFFPNSG